MTAFNFPFKIPFLLVVDMSGYCLALALIPLVFVLILCKLGFIWIFIEINVIY